MAAPVKVKICGITSVEDALMSVEAGADAIGLVFYPPSPRFINVEIAREIALAVGPFVTVTGLFVDAGNQEVDDILQRVPLHVLQFHGDELAAYCDSFHRPYLKAIRMKPGIIVEDQINAFPAATGILLDAYRPGIPGGTGETFDWGRVPKSSAKPIVLAGGLSVANVKQAVISTSPYGVDVSGGVEVAPGKKNAVKVSAFIRCAKIGETV